MLCALLGTLLDTFAARSCRRNCTSLLEKEINHNDGSQTHETCTSGHDNYPVHACTAQGQAFGHVHMYIIYNYMYICIYVLNYIM